MAQREVQHIADRSSAGRTLTAVLREAAAVSHAIARGIIEAGLVRVRGRVVRDPAHRLSEGDELLARFDPDLRYRTAARPRGHGFRILLEDEHLLVVDKDPGVLTVPAPSHPDDSLADRLIGMYTSRGVRTPGLWVVHRIDRFTSGLVLFGRTEAAAAALIEQFQSRSAAREYLALCEGIPGRPSGRLESRLEEDPRSLKVRVARRAGAGARAVCSYQIEQPLDGAALLRVTLETGRRNQIRVQLAEIGHPILGDRAYGRVSPLLGRTGLHAARLAFRHPATQAVIRIESPLPADMRRALRRLRGRANRVRPS
ncbi:MAG: RluA family pseudouridine synthase [Candidatus Polarisedimenticolia bacterium]